MRVDARVVVHTAALARLHVPEERLDALAAELSAILDYADQLGAVPNLDLGVASGGAPGTLPRRADVPGLPLGPLGIAGAADRQGDEVRVPTVVGDPT